MYTELTKTEIKHNSFNLFITILRPYIYNLSLRVSSKTLVGKFEKAIRVHNFRDSIASSKVGLVLRYKLGIRIIDTGFQVVKQTHNGKDTKKSDEGGMRDHEGVAQDQAILMWAKEDNGNTWRL